jgi:type II secretory pathway component GspD/PulD (secretin)
MNHGNATRVLLLVFVASMLWGHTAAQEQAAPEGFAKAVLTVKPRFLPPTQILGFLGVNHTTGLGILEWPAPDGLHVVEIRSNDAANLIILTGAPADLEFVETLIGEADVPPRQIEIEVQIVEVSVSKARDLGLDWQLALDGVLASDPSISYRRDQDEYDVHEVRVSPPNSPTEELYRRETSDDYLSISAHPEIKEIIKILDESGAGTIRNAPRILTLNNRRASILDGERITYVTRYSSYSNLFEADSMDAGLTLSVLPSLGESGYITMEITAELTALTGQISGSPVKTGQMLENTVVVRDGQSVPLGGLTRTVETEVHRRFPGLGYILPFLFSRKTTVREEIESYLILTPRVVDFEPVVE